MQYIAQSFKNIQNASMVVLEVAVFLSKLFVHCKINTETNVAKNDYKGRKKKPRTVACKNARFLWVISHCKYVLINNLYILILFSWYKDLFVLFHAFACHSSCCLETYCEAFNGNLAIVED